VTPRLSVRDLRVGYGYGTAAVDGYDVDLVGGTVHVLLGRNGAGKTSTLRGIVGPLPHEPATVSGAVVVDGSPVRRRDPLRSARLGVGLVVERDKVFPNLTVGEQLTLAAGGARGAGADGIPPVVQRFPQLSSRTGVRAGLLSGGERQMLAIALVLLTRPTVLLVDELSLGLAPGVARDLMGHLRRLADEEGLAVLAVDQSAAAALDIADAVQVMDGGRVVASGSPREIEVGHVLDAYLGRHER
jgi:branched-chain amino acid transport system ATP-binding protein